MTTTFLSDVQLEGMAGRWLGHDESICGAVAGPSGAGGAHPQSVLATIRRCKRT